MLNDENKIFLISVPMIFFFSFPLVLGDLFVDFWDDDISLTIFCYISGFFSFPLVLGLLFYPWLPTSSKTGRGGG